MRSSLGLIAISVLLWFGPLSVSNAKFEILYPNAGTENINLYTFTAAATGEIGAYFYNAEAVYTNTLVLLVNGVITPESAAGVLNNHTSSKGDFANLGSVHAGDLLTFQLNVLTTGRTFYSDKLLNGDGINHVYSTPFSGDAVHGIPAGTYVGFEDLRGGGDRDYDDEAFIFTNVVVPVVPEPETNAMLLAGLGLLAFMTRHKKESAV